MSNLLQRSGRACAKSRISFYPPGEQRASRWERDEVFSEGDKATEESEYETLGIQNHKLRMRRFCSNSSFLTLSHSAVPLMVYPQALQAESPHPYSCCSSHAQKQTHTHEPSLGAGTTWSKKLLCFGSSLHSSFSVPPFSWTRWDLPFRLRPAGGC